jgi:hypothetical protein
MHSTANLPTIYDYDHLTRIDQQEVFTLNQFRIVPVSQKYSYDF